MMLPQQHTDVFQAWLNAEDMPHLPKTLAVGWSGGADSTALLLALKESGYAVHAWHVDHGWRESSAQEAAYLAEQAAHWNIPFISARLTSASTRNREAEARQGRHALFRQWSNAQNIRTLCLAHHRDDQAETVCMRLLQGAGAGGCRGMLRERQMGELRIVRPLLHIAARDLRHALRAAGIAWLEDPSNADMSIWRNHIRHQLFPAILQKGEAPDTLFLRWRVQAERVACQLDHEADVILHDLTRTGDHSLRLCWKTWKQSTPAVRARALQKCMAQLLGDGATPGRRHILLVESWTNKSGRGGLDLSRCRLYRESDYLHLRLHLQPVTAVCAA